MIEAGIILFHIYNTPRLNALARKCVVHNEGTPGLRDHCTLLCRRRRMYIPPTPFGTTSRDLCAGAPRTGVSSTSQLHVRWMSNDYYFEIDTIIYISRKIKSKCKLNIYQQSEEHEPRGYIRRV